MTFSIYQVEFVSEREGQRLFHHVSAESPEDAIAQVSVYQKTPAIKAEEWRPCSVKEEGILEAKKAAQEAADQAARDAAALKTLKVG